MKRSHGLLAAGAAAIGALALIIARPGGHPGPASPPAAVSAGGVTLASAAIAMPVDEGQFPAGAGADLVNANCTACHSASMALGQPPLSADQWKAEVTKMREAYHAPVAEADVPAIVAYLTAMSGRATTVR